MAALGILVLHTIIYNLDPFMPEIESSDLESLLLILSFAALAPCFLVIFNREKIGT